MFLSRLRGFLGQSVIRQAIGLLAVFSVISAAVWAATYWLVEREISRLVDARLEALATAAAEAPENALPAPGFGQILAVLQNGRVVAGSAPDRLLRQATRRGFHNVDGADMHHADLRFLLRDAGDRQILVAETVERQEELLEVLSGGLRSALIASLAATLLAGLWMARRNQARLDLVNAGLGKVAHGDLQARIRLPDRGDDLSLLADRIDATVERLAQAMEQMRVQSSNIAHDLRTPLARLRAGTESRYLALVEDNKAVSAEDLEDALDQIDRIVGTFDALLRIARLDSGARKASFRKVDLAEVVRIVTDAFGPVVEDTGQRLEVSVTDPAHVQGDRDLLVQLLANLIQNALRYGPEGQTITLSLHGRVLSVTDQGPGIPFAERGKVLEPLYQMEAARQGDGFGLGLSLVRAISDLHGAVLTLTDGPDARGLNVKLRLPELTDL